MNNDKKSDTGICTYNDIFLTFLVNLRGCVLKQEKV